MLVRESRDQHSFDNFPGLIAVFHALHSLLMPRHPPCALSSLTTLIQPSPRAVRTGRLRDPSPEHASSSSNNVVATATDRGAVTPGIAPRRTPHRPPLRNDLILYRPLTGSLRPRSEIAFSPGPARRRRLSLSALRAVQEHARGRPRRPVRAILIKCHSSTHQIVKDRRADRQRSRAPVEQGRGSRKSSPVGGRPRLP